jgi:hypothetical protein
MAIHEDFSLVRGGPLYRLGLAIGGPTTRGALTWLSVAIALLTWLPLLALNAFGSTLTSGSTIPFFPSLGAHVRLLLAIPLFFAAEFIFDRRVRQVVSTIVETGVVTPADVPRLDAALTRAQRWGGSSVVEAALVVATIAAIASGLRSDLPAEMSTWRVQGGGLTPAGWWYTIVSLPIFQFLFWRWVARLIVWTWVLWSIARLDLHLIPTHPDTAGGLGIFGVVHLSLAPLAFAATAMLVASIAEQILFGGARLPDFALPLAGGVVGTTFVLVAPLALFMAKQIRAKQLGLIEYGALAARYSRAFDRKWLRDPAGPEQHLLGTADIQSLADMSGAFDVVRAMRILPIAPSQILLLATAAALPASPLILLVIPLDELILQFFKTVLHI